MAKKIKEYTIMVSRTFPAYHSKKGKPTGFVGKIINTIAGVREAQISLGDKKLCETKLHTFRGKFLLWEKRINEVLAGEAEIVVKYHTLGRYVKGNKQIEFARLDKDSGVGIQEAIYMPNFEVPFDGVAIRCEGGLFRDFPFYEVSKNDGLSHPDFTEWFVKGNYDLTESMACIHFTSFRYGRNCKS